MSNFQLVEKKVEEDQLIITLKIESNIFVARKDKVFNKLTRDMAITGFRPGKAPKAMLEARLGADLYEKTLNELLPEITYKYLTQEKIDFLGGIDYEVLKVSDAEGVEYRITFVKYPEITLPKFSKIKVEDEKVELSEEEVEIELNKIFKYKDESSSPKSEEGLKESSPAKKEEINDEKVKSLGVGLNSVDELKDLLRKQLLEQKQNLSTNNKVQKVIDEAIKLAKIPAPEKLLDQEVSKKEHNYEHRIEQLGLKIEDFLKTQKTTIEEMRKGWKSEAEKQVQTDLLLFEIAKVNQLKVENDEVNAEINALKDEKLKAQYDSYEGRTYVSGIILQQKALDWLMRETGIIKVKEEGKENEAK